MKRLHASPAEITRKAAWLRRETFEMVVRARKGHYPSSSSCTDFLVNLVYGGYLQCDPGQPEHPDRDRVFISKGHAGMALYPVLADLGYYGREEVERFTRADALLKFYPDPEIPGIEAITGSLGHGLGIAAGHCLAGRMEGRSFQCFVVVSDGECYEGSTWETAMFAAHQQLARLVAFIDRNGCCILDHTENCVALDPLADKWRSFGWKVIEIDGHSHDAIRAALDLASAHTEGPPIAIVGRTVKGKGVSFMEDRPGWHNRMPDEAQIAQARAELATPAEEVAR